MMGIASFLFFSVVALILPANAADSCDGFVPVAFHPAKINFKDSEGKLYKDYAIMQADVDSYRLDAGDTPAFITNRDTGKSCVAKVKIVDGDPNDVYWLQGTTQVAYVSHDGAMQWVSLIEMSTCKKVWESRPNIGSRIEKDLIRLSPDCGRCEETHNFSGVCNCRSAEVWKLANCKVQIDKAMSEKVTGEDLHVAFYGRRKLKNAKSEDAKLLK